ncbi:MAG: C-GCAxxG-C-C family protein [Planctomycetota bacterium]|nr:C-GCAxxG-C-C family protein [Planctomycetota bacterium]
MNNKSEIAVAKFLKGYNCAQAIIYAFSDDLGMDKNTALKIACGFGAGMGRKQEVCGAVTGGIMVIGLKYGRGENDDRKVMDLAYVKVRSLMDRFSEKHGTFICRKLVGECELTTDEGQKQYREKDLLHKVCGPCVGTVAEILEDILLQG